VSRLREELERAANRPVTEVVAGGTSTDGDFDTAGHDVFIGTSATLHRLHRVDVVAFIDFDRELLAPRFLAHEQAMALLAKAARLIGPRSGGGRILLQTTLGDHEVVRAALEGDVSILSVADLHRRQSLGLPPFSALALVEGDGVLECETALSGVEGVSVSRHRDHLLIRTATHQDLSAAWMAIPQAVRSTVRIEVDPVSV
jgi:primosomal protein N' (replication factor Y)